MEDAVAVKKEQKVLRPEEAVRTNIQLLAGTHPEGVRGAGFLTAGDIRAIKRYVNLVVPLPSELPEIEVMMGYKTIGIAGLEPIDFKPLFDTARTHGQKWQPLESSLREQAADLEAAADNILTTGNSILELVKTIPTKEGAGKTLGDILTKEVLVMKEEDIRIKHKELEKERVDDKEIKNSVGEILLSMKADVIRHAEKTKALKDRVVSYNKELTLVHGQFLQKQVLLNSSSLDDKLNAVIKDIEQKEKDFNDAITAYETNTTYCFLGLAGGLVGFTIASSIFGGSADEAKKRRDELKVELDAKRKERETIEKNSKILNSLISESESLSPRFTDAMKALNDLETTWQRFASFIDNSRNAFEKINNKLSLVMFWVNFRKVVKPWEEVKDISVRVTAAMNEALDEK